MCVFVCGSVTTITGNCVHCGFVAEGSDHLQLIKFWPSSALGKGSAAGRNFYGSTLLQSVRSIFVSSERFFILSFLEHMEHTPKTVTYLLHHISEVVNRFCLHFYSVGCVQVSKKSCGVKHLLM